MTRLKSTAWNTQLAVLGMLLLGVAALYWQGLSGDLVVDDIPNLQPLADLKTGAIDWQDVVFSNDSGPLGRPIAMASLVIDMYLGDGATFQYKLTNLLIHLLSGVLIFSLACKLYSTRDDLPREVASWSALLAAALWLAAPLFASTVLYVIQRMAQLSAFFSLLGLLMYAHGRLVLDVDARRGFALIAATYLVALPAAVLSKENGILLPALVFIVEAYWFGFRASPQVRRVLITVHCVAFAIPCVVVLLLLPFRWSALADGYQGRGFTIDQRLLTQARVLWDYLRQLVLPDGIRMGVVHDDYPASVGLFEPFSTFTSIIAWGGVLVLMLSRHFRDRMKWLSFGFAFFLFGHAIESTVVPLELYFEHRNYLPAAGFLIGAVAFVAAAVHRLPNLRRFAPLLALLPLLYGFISYQRVMVWQSAEAIARIAETSHPHSPRLQTALISMYARDGDLAKSFDHIRRLADLEGGLTAAHALHKLYLFCELKQRPRPQDYLEINGLARLPDSVYAKERMTAIADSLSFRGCDSVDFNRLRGWLLGVAKQSDGDWIMAFQMARILEALGNSERAIELLNAADRLDPARLEPSLLKLRILIAKNDLEEARRVIESIDEGDIEPKRYQIDLIDGYRRYLKSKG